LSYCITQRDVRRQDKLVSPLLPLGPQQVHRIHVATDFSCGGSRLNFTLQFLRLTEEHLNTALNMRLVRANDKNHTKATIDMLVFYKDLLSASKYADTHAVKIIILIKI